MESSSSERTTQRRTVHNPYKKQKQNEISEVGQISIPINTNRSQNPRHRRIVHNPYLKQKHNAGTYQPSQISVSANTNQLRKVQNPYKRTIHNPYSKQKCDNAETHQPSQSSIPTNTSQPTKVQNPYKRTVHNPYKKQKWDNETPQLDQSSTPTNTSRPTDVQNPCKRVVGKSILRTPQDKKVSTNVPAIKSSNNMDSKKQVQFVNEKNTVHIYECDESELPFHQDEEMEDGTVVTEEMTLLSSKHGRARRKLRSISKHDLRSAVKYGVKTSSVHPRTGKPRWKFEYNGVTYITEEDCRTEVTSWRGKRKNPEDLVTIDKCTITESMLERHREVQNVLENEPHLCVSHSIVVIDQSGSMRNEDVDYFQNRSHAAYGTFALDFIAPQLYERGDDVFVDAVTIIEMRTKGEIVFNRVPLDWILFNNLLDRQTQAKPRFDGNYTPSLQCVHDIIEEDRKVFEDIDIEDHPNYMLIFLSDGKPSDTRPMDTHMRNRLLRTIANSLKSKLAVTMVGLAAVNQFSVLESCVDIVKECGSDGTFNHAQLSPSMLGTALSQASATVTSMRTQSLVGNLHEKKEEKTTQVIKLRERKDKKDFHIYKRGIARYSFDYNRYTSELRYKEEERWPWKRQPFIHEHQTAGFAVDKVAFGKGAERLAFRFYELDRNDKRLGTIMVAKESKYEMNDEESKVNFHSVFCRVQNKASHLARVFNDRVKYNEVLGSSNVDGFRPPQVEFVQCHVYECLQYGEKCGLLVEPLLKGKFIKWNSNNGYVRNQRNTKSITLNCGEVMMSDFLHAFSHWTYEESDHDMIVVDLQGIFDEEARYPMFRLTDPVICSSSRAGERFGQTDCRKKGITRFCQTHRCNSVCKALGLPPTRGKNSRNRSSQNISLGATKRKFVEISF